MVGPVLDDLQSQSLTTTTTDWNVESMKLAVKMAGEVVELLQSHLTQSWTVRTGHKQEMSIHCQTYQAYKDWSPESMCVAEQRW